jgi:ABC-type spermidine/putrescine transport system permease subunit I
MIVCKSVPFTIWSFYFLFSFFFFFFFFRCKDGLKEKGFHEASRAWKDLPGQFASWSSFFRTIRAANMSAFISLENWEKLISYS